MNYNKNKKECVTLTYIILIVLEHWENFWDSNLLSTLQLVYICG